MFLAQKRAGFLGTICPSALFLAWSQRFVDFMSGLRETGPPKAAEYTPAGMYSLSCKQNC